MKNVVCLAVHGIGTYRENSGILKEFDKELRNAVAKEMGTDFEKVEWRPVYWSNGELFKRQFDLLKERKPEKFLKDIFDFAISALSDASSFQLYEDDGRQAYERTAYFEIHSAIWKTLHDIEVNALGEGSHAPVVLVAQSMGCHVMSSYIWDAQHKHERVLPDPNTHTISDFTALETLSSVIFTGCNIPLLAMGLPRDAKTPLKAPGAHGKIGGEWMNFYDPDDVLGYPLKPEYAPYFGLPGAPPHQHAHRFGGWGRDPDRELRPVDRKIEINWFKGGFTPLSHLGYWRDRRVIEQVAGELWKCL